MYDVIRNFGVDYIYFDLIFLLLFIFLLIKGKEKIALVAIFVGGLINFFIDWGIWYNLTGIREIVLPNINAVLFFLWFSISYGLEYAWVFLMFKKRPNILKWTIVLFVGWILVGLLSQIFPINDAIITTIRHMGSLRVWRVVIVVAGYSLLFILRYNWKKIGYLFLIGFAVHFMMEFSLLITGIRPGSFLILLENSLIEFNMGVPILYLIYDKLLNKHEYTI
jgi:hypothetical protein